jgi:hypothetical protein
LNVVSLPEVGRTSCDAVSLCDLGLSSVALQGAAYPVVCVHGDSSTGKTGVVRDVLRALRVPTAYVRSALNPDEALPQAGGVHNGRIVGFLGRWSSCCCFCPRRAYSRYTQRPGVCGAVQDSPPAISKCRESITEMRGIERDSVPAGAFSGTRARRCSRPSLPPGSTTSATRRRRGRRVSALDRS